MGRARRASATGGRGWKKSGIDPIFSASPWSWPTLLASHPVRRRSRRVPVGVGAVSGSGSASAGKSRSGCEAAPGSAKMRLTSWSGGPKAAEWRIADRGASRPDRPGCARIVRVSPALKKHRARALRPALIPLQLRSAGSAARAIRHRRWPQGRAGFGVGAPLPADRRESRDLRAPSL